MSLIEVENQIKDLEMQRNNATGEEYDQLTMQIEELQKKRLYKLNSLGSC